MKTNTIKMALVAAIGFQFLILVGEYVSAATPLWTGQEVKVRTIPVDPRSMFRGNYARLRYEFSEIPAEEFPKVDGVYKTKLRNGDIIYIVLEKGKNGYHRRTALSFAKPSDGIFIRGRIQKHYYSAKNIRIKYGIEAFFAPKEKAIQLEVQLRDSAVAILMVDGSGKAVLKEIVSTDN